MAAEGAVVDAPIVPEKPAGTVADPKTTPDTGGKPAASQPEQKWEDDPRVKGMLADLKKEREARQNHERKLAELDSALKEERRRVGALSGITPPDPKQADAEAVRAKILELMPELAEVGSLADIRAQLEAQQVQGFAEHSTRMLSQIHQAIAAEYGDLTDAQKRRINAVYLYENQMNPDLHARHNQGDPTLVTEFAKAFLDDMVEPIKKKATASEAARFRPVPGGRDRSTPVRGEKPKSGEDMLRAHFRANR